MKLWETYLDKRLRALFNVSGLSFKMYFLIPNMYWCKYVSQSKLLISTLKSLQSPDAPTNFTSFVMLSAQNFHSFIAKNSPVLAARSKRLVIFIILKKMMHRNAIIINRIVFFSRVWLKRESTYIGLQPWTLNIRSTINAGKKCNVATIIVWINLFVLNVKSGYHMTYFEGDSIACFLVRYPNSRHLQEIIFFCYCFTMFTVFVPV